MGHPAFMQRFISASLTWMQQWMTHTKWACLCFNKTLLTKPKSMVCQACPRTPSAPRQAVAAITCKNREETASSPCIKHWLTAALRARNVWACLSGEAGSEAGEWSSQASHPSNFLATTVTYRKHLPAVSHQVHKLMLVPLQRCLSVALKAPLELPWWSSG